MYVDPSGHATICIDGVQCFDPDVNPYDLNWNENNGGNNSGNNDVTADLPGDIDEDVGLFCGSNTSDARLEGPECAESMPGWVPYIADWYEVRYQYGGKLPTARFALNNHIFSMSVDLSLVAYSGGTEAALMYAKVFTEAGGTLENLVLLGPTFTANNEAGL